MAYKTINGITSSIISFYLWDGTFFVLLGQRRRKSKAFANSWALVGGFLDPGPESLEQCVARELKEETGIEVSPMSVKLVTVQSDPNAIHAAKSSIPCGPLSSSLNFLLLLATTLRPQRGICSARLSMWI